MKVVVTGATGNVGTALLRALEADEQVREVVGIPRRRPALRIGKVTWLEADVAHADLRPHFATADAVVHLAWLIQPSRDERVTHAVNAPPVRRPAASECTGAPRLRARRPADRPAALPGRPRPRRRRGPTGWPS